MFFPLEKNIGAVYLRIDPNHTPGDKFPFIQLAVRELMRKGSYKITPDQGLIHYLWMLPCRDFREVNNIKMALQKFFAFLLTHGIIVEYVKGIIFLIFRVNAIAGKTAPQAVASVVHNRDGTYDGIP